MYTIWHVDKHGRTKVGEVETEREAVTFVNSFYHGKFLPGHDTAEIVNPYGVVLKRYEVDWMASSQFTPVPGKVWTFPSSSSSSVYTTQINTTGILSCNCRGWTFKKPGKARWCKHTTRVIAAQRLNTEERGNYIFVIDEKLTAAKKKFAAPAVAIPKTPQERFTFLLTKYEAAVDHMASLDPNQMLEAAIQVEQLKFQVESYLLLLEQKGIDGMAQYEAAQAKIGRVMQ